MSLFNNRSDDYFHFDFKFLSKNHQSIKKLNNLRYVSTFELELLVLSLFILGEWSKNDYNLKLLYLVHQIIFNCLFIAAATFKKYLNNLSNTISSVTLAFYKMLKPTFLLSLFYSRYMCFSVRSTRCSI